VFFSLVTIQEAGWESFSEDETPPASAPSAKAAAPSAPAAAAPKGKKSGAKTGQGSIMSFFAKK
jgi:DNA polymerase delta subunit 3